MIALWVTLSLGFEVISHRGVRQTYPYNLGSKVECTADKIFEPTHNYIEHTLRSIEAAFEFGATMVQVAIHTTDEGPGRDPELVVFHDWTLGCRTNATCEEGCKCNKGRCVTREQSLAFLKTLDVGYGYSFAKHGLRIYPFRGMNVGGIPTLREVLDLLYRWPNKKILVNQKDKQESTARTFLRLMAEYPKSIRERVLFPYDVGLERELDEVGVKDGPSYRSRAKDCFMDFVIWGWLLGFSPEKCTDIQVLVPIHTKMWGREVPRWMWGWPGSFNRWAQETNTGIYPADMDSEEDLSSIEGAGFPGLMTGKIEVVGPLLSKD